MRDRAQRDREPSIKTCDHVRRPSGLFAGCPLLLLLQDIPANSVVFGSGGSRGSRDCEVQDAWSSAGIPCGPLFVWSKCTAAVCLIFCGAYITVSILWHVFKRLLVQPPQSNRIHSLFAAIQTLSHVALEQVGTAATTGDIKHCQPTLQQLE